MIRFSTADRAGFVMVLLVAAAVPAACLHQVVSNTSASSSPKTAATSSNAALSDSLVLAGKMFPLHEVQCLGLGGAVLVNAKIPSGEIIIVDTAGGKLETLDFTVDNVGYFWEPTSTGGAPTPLLIKDGNSYTVAGKIKQLHDSTKFSDFSFSATCPR